MGLTDNFSSERVKARTKWDDIFSTEINCQPKILYPVKLSFKTENKTPSPNGKDFGKFAPP